MARGNNRKKGERDMPDEHIIVITGSSRGIGAGLARHFSGQGQRVVINYSKSAAEAEALYRELSASAGGEKLMLIQADVADRQQVKHLFREVNGHWGPADVLINNAGLNIDRPFLELADDDWDRVLATNLRGPFVCAQEFAFQFKGEKGCIINIASTTAIRGRKNGANYCSSKAGVITLTKCLALELVPAILVHCIVPGFIETEEVVNRFQLHIKENYEAAVSTTPLGRLGTVEDIYHMADFLVSKAAYTTGQCFFVTGGFFMR